MSLSDDSDVDIENVDCTMALPQPLPDHELVGGWTHHHDISKNELLRKAERSKAERQALAKLFDDLRSLLNLNSKCSIHHVLLAAKSEILQLTATDSRAEMTLRRLRTEFKALMAHKSRIETERSVLKEGAAGEAWTLKEELNRATTANYSTAESVKVFTKKLQICCDSTKSW